MAFTQFKSIGEVAKKYHIYIKSENFVQTTPIYNTPELLQKEIKISLQLGMYKHSEAAICEQLIHPVLRSLWLNSFLDELLLWSHTAVYGVVTNGLHWEFGKLKDKILFKDYDVNLTIAELDKLYTALYYILTDCKQQLALNKQV